MPISSGEESENTDSSDSENDDEISIDDFLNIDNDNSFTEIVE